MPSSHERSILSTAQENLATVQSIYAAFGQGDVATILSHVADDVDWSAEAALPVAGWYGVKRGKAQVPSFFEGLAKDIEVTEFTPLAFGTSEDGDVFVTIRFGFTGVRTGKAVTMELHHWWQLRDGKVVRYRGTEDTALTASVLA